MAISITRWASGGARKGTCDSAPGPSAPSHRLLLRRSQASPSIPFRERSDGSFTGTAAATTRRPLRAVQQPWRFYGVRLRLPATGAGPLAEGLDVHVVHGCDVQRQQLRDEQAADYRESEGPARLSARA